MKVVSHNAKAFAGAAAAALAAGLGLVIWLRGPGAPPPAPPLPTAAPAGSERPASALIDQAILAAQQQPKDAALALEVGSMLGDSSRYSEAMAWFRRAEALDPKLVPAITGQGQMWQALGRPLQAAQHYERALKLVPNEPSLLLELSRTYLYLRDFGTSLRYVQEAQAADGQNPAVFRQLSSVYAEMLDAKRGQEALDQAEKLAPQDPETWKLRARLLQRNQRAPEAEIAARKAVALAPGDPDARLLLARAIIEVRRNQQGDREAFAALAAARSLDPGNPDALFLQGQILLRVGELSQAIGLLRQAREASPRNPEVARALGQALVKAGRGQEGVQVLAAAQKLPPFGVGFSGLENQAAQSTDVTVHLRLADLYRRQELHDSEIYALERALRRIPGDARLQARLAQARREAGRFGPPR